MDNVQRLSVLRAVAISSGAVPVVGSYSSSQRQQQQQRLQQQRAEAYDTLEQFKSYDGRIGASIYLLSCERHVLPLSAIDPLSSRPSSSSSSSSSSSTTGAGDASAVATVDVTAPTKLYALGMLQSFVRAGKYSSLAADSDRVAFRSSVLGAARQLVAASSLSSYSSSALGATTTSSSPPPSPLSEGEIRMLGNKIASLLGDVAVCDFPQRWPTFVSDIFTPPTSGGGGGLWYEPGRIDEAQSRGGQFRVDGGNNGSLGVGVGSSSSSSAAAAAVGPGVAVGVGCGCGAMIGVKIGLECLKLMVEDCTDSDFNSKISTRRRNDILIGLNETSSQFLPAIYALLSEEYGIVCSAKSTLAEMASYLAGNGRTVGQMTAEERVLYDAQVRRRDGAARLLLDCLDTVKAFCQTMPLDWILPDGSGGGGGGPDFASALLHLLREDAAELQVSAASCLQMLATRKLEQESWLRLVSALPGAVSEANEAAAASAAAAMSWADPSAMLTEKFPFHLELSRLLAQLMSAHLNYITTDKDLIAEQGPNVPILASYLQLLAEMVGHPSGRICGEQINMWISLLRDPQIPKTSLLSPYLSRVLAAYMQHTVRIRWDDVEEQSHPYASLMEASWVDKDAYDSWHADIRSKASQLFKLVGHTEPVMSVAVLHGKFQSILSSHGNGEPRDHLDPQSNQLTPLSEAHLQFEGLHQPLDNILQGIPQWAVDTNRSPTDQKRADIRSTVRSSLSAVTSMIVSWNPADTYLRIRRCDLLNALKHYWKYDPTTLASGVDALLVYLSAEDDRSVTAASDDPQSSMSGETIALRKRSGVCLVSVAKQVPHLLVPWLGQLSDRASALLGSSSLLPPNQMHLYEFLSCVATAVEDPVARANFIAGVLANALEVVNSLEVMDATSSVEGLMTTFGIAQASTNPAYVTDPENVSFTISKYVRLFSAFNQLLSVGKRCHEAAKKRPNGGIPLQNVAAVSSAVYNQPGQQNFPDEGPVRIDDLAVNDPFVPLWPRFLPSLIRTMDVTLKLWHPEYQAILLRNSIQRYAYAISDDEAYLAMKQDSSIGGVFGKGGTAGSVVSGWDRRDTNLAPKWSGWFNELRNTCFQLLGLFSAQRALYAPEMASMFPEFLSVVANPAHLSAFEHRHFTQYFKQFIEILLLTCPATLYRSHLSPILEPVFGNLVFRMGKSWAPILDLSVSSDLTAALTTPRCENAAALALTGGNKWLEVYYARGGLFVGDLDAVTAEAAVEKVRVELCRTFSDVLQSALALKGEWALVIANQAKEDQATRKNDPSKLISGPKTRMADDEGVRVNADGTPRGENEIAIEARKSLRIHRMCRFLLLEDERIAYSMVTGVVECLRYPDAYTCRRCTRICHRILETVAWDSRYTDILGNRLFSIAVEAIVTEPKWMVGIEWDMINLIRDIYCRLVLGQLLLPGGQGPALQQPRDPRNAAMFEQAKNADNPLLGGGILCQPSSLPQQLLAGLPGAGVEAVQKLDAEMTEKRAAKDQKDALRDMLRIIADNLKGYEADGSRVFVRAEEEESLLNQKSNRPAVPDVPEKLVTQSMMAKKQAEELRQDIPAEPALTGLFG